MVIRDVNLCVEVLLYEHVVVSELGCLGIQVIASRIRVELRLRLLLTLWIHILWIETLHILIIILLHRVVRLMSLITRRHLPIVHRLPIVINLQRVVHKVVCD